jgi:hypothetical protein
MAFIKTPLTYENNSLVIARDIEEQIAMIDNFIEFIVFSPKGSFAADDDFGFDYWNHEYSNVHLQSFNLGQDMNFTNGLYNEITLKECKESIEKSLEAYEPQLKQVGVSIELGAVKTDRESSRKLLSKYEVTIRITGMLDDGLSTLFPYKKEVSFLMEPTVKRINI